MTKAPSKGELMQRLNLLADRHSRLRRALEFISNDGEYGQLSKYTMRTTAKDALAEDDANGPQTRRERSLKGRL